MDWMDELPVLTINELEIDSMYELSMIILQSTRANNSK